MRVFETVLYEYILGYVLQGFTLILGIYAFCRQKIKLDKYLISSFMMIVIIYLMRYIMDLLNISFGLHTILSLICALFIGVFYLKIPIFTALKSMLAITILLIFTEGLLSVLFMTQILGPETFNLMMSDKLGKAVIALPSSLLFALLVVVSYFLGLRLEKKKRAKNGE